MINTPLKESVGQMLDNDLTEFDRHSLSENDQNSVEMIDELVDSMIDTNTLVPEVNDMFKELRIPLLKVILKDDSFFDSRVHPARQVLDRIARLGAQGTANPNLKKQLDQTVSNIIEHDNEGLDIYFDELKKLDKIIDKQNTIYKKNVDRITKVCEGQQKTNKARQRVFQEIDKRTAGKSIPKLALDCLDGGWRNLLLLTSIREGEESKNWGLFLQVLDRLLLLNEKKAPHVKVDLFINVLKTGLTTACGGQFKHAQLVEEIKAIIDQQESGTHTCNLELVDIPPIDNQEQEKPPAARESVKDEQGKVFAIGKPNERFSRWVKRAKRMQLGDWLELKADDNSVQKVRLAWVGEDFSKIVFINHQGLKVIDLSLQEIASLLQDRKAKFIVEQDNSIVNVALENMVKKIYDNLAHQATHDDMTDLLTRNEFERRIDRSIELALGEKFAHCVCHIAIHQFKLLKTTYSYEESDQILQEFAKAINNIMTMDNIHCGRIGDSDFGVLFENVGTEEAYHLLSKFTEHLENNKIQISDKTIGLNVNIGLVGIKTHKAKISGILKQAEQASETAEKAGINRIHIYTEEVQTKREEISWVSNVDSILNEGKLHLRSQAIQSLKKGDNDAWSHSEILLAVVDDQGKERSPEDLIYVAEEFRKMSLIDRWVIKNIFNWMSNNPAEVEKLGGCSINLSGHSLNDESFTEFLFEEFANTTLDKKQICFEITETTAIANLEEAADFISELRNYGCHFSLDDFGSGLSSYAYLKHLPVDFIKIDGSFIRQLKAESNEYAMVKSISDMGHYMGKEIIAESVENKEIMDLLKTIGIDYAQGYYIQKPQTLSLS